MHAAYYENKGSREADCGEYKAEHIIHHGPIDQTYHEELGRMENSIRTRRKISTLELHRIICELSSVYRDTRKSNLSARADMVDDRRARSINLTSLFGYRNSQTENPLET